MTPRGRSGDQLDPGSEQGRDRVARREVNVGLTWGWRGVGVGLAWAIPGSRPPEIDISKDLNTQATTRRGLSPQAISK